MKDSKSIITNKSPRITSRAIIIKDDKLLCLRANTTIEEWFVIPGGGQEVGELLDECVIREIKEELEIDIKVIKMLYIAEYIPYEELENPRWNQHLVSFFYHCEIIGDQKAVYGKEMDPDISHIKWIPLNELDKKNVLPLEVRDAIISDYDNKNGFSYELKYLGRARNHR